MTVNRGVTSLKIFEGTTPKKVYLGTSLLYEPITYIAQWVVTPGTSGSLRGYSNQDSNAGASADLGSVVSRDSGGFRLSDCRSVDNQFIFGLYTTAGETPDASAWSILTINNGSTTYTFRSNVGVASIQSSARLWQYVGTNYPTGLHSLPSPWTLTIVDPRTIPDQPGILSVSVVRRGSNYNFSYSITDPNGVRSVTAATVTANDGRVAPSIVGDFSRTNANTFSGTRSRRNARWASGTLSLTYVDDISGDSHTLTKDWTS